MKRITTIMLVCLFTVCTYGQQSLVLKVKKSSDLPITATEHFYLLEITNTSGVSQEFNIVTSDKVCDDIQQSKQVSLNKQVLNSQKTNQFNAETIKANSSMEFFVKISRKSDTPLGKWNCIEVKAVSNGNETISNMLTIKSLIPDPKNFH